MVLVGRFVWLVGGVGGQASRRDAGHLAGERSYLVGAALREPASFLIFARCVPPVRQPAPGTLLVARLRETSGQCALFGYQLRLNGSLVRYYLWLQVISGWLLSAILVAG